MGSRKGDFSLIIGLKNNTGRSSRQWFGVNKRVGFKKIRKRLNKTILR